MSSTLPDLPVEIIDLIGTFTQPTDLRSLRLVCSKLNNKTLDQFALRNFAIIRSDLSRKSLQRLQKISQNEHFAKSVQCLRIYYHDDGTLGKGYTWTRHPTGSLIQGPNECTHLLQDMLSKRLMKCRSFSFENTDEYEPDLAEDCIVPSDAVGLVLSMIARCKLLTKSFEIQNLSHYGRLHTPRLQTSVCETPDFLTSWAHIESINLDYVITDDQYEWILHLISSAKSLRELSLGFHERQHSFIDSLVKIPQLNVLEKFSLRIACVDEYALSTILLNNCSTLRSLSLANIILEKQCNWSSLFTKMRGRLPQLHNLSIHRLNQDTTTRVKNVKFDRLKEYPVIPGSEERGAQGRLKYDTHWIVDVEEPLRLRYWGKKEFVVGIEYHGKDIDPLFGALADTTEPS